VNKKKTEYNMKLIKSCRPKRRRRREITVTFHRKMCSNCNANECPSTTENSVIFTSLSVGWFTHSFMRSFMYAKD